MRDWHNEVAQARWRPGTLYRVGRDVGVVLVVSGEREQEQERLGLDIEDPRTYYSYEERFIKQKLEKDRMAILPRVVHPSDTPRDGFVLGGLRTFDRYAVAPISSLTGQFLDVDPGATTALRRLLPAQVAYVLRGGGVSLQGGREFEISTDDVVTVPSYTEFQWRAGEGGLRLWLPQVRIWHVIGLLWEEFEELEAVPEGCRPLTEGGTVVGFEVPAGTLGLERPLRVRPGAEARRREFFDRRRSAPPVVTNGSRYDWFLDRLAEENRIEEQIPRVIRGKDCPLERTRQGMIAFYLHPWMESVAPHLDLMVQTIEPGGASGLHRHVAEEVVVVLQGRGHDVHEQEQFAWAEGDVVCIPTLTSHRHVNDGDEPVRLVSVWARERMHQYLGGFDQLEDAPSWSGE